MSRPNYTPVARLSGVGLTGHPVKKLIFERLNFAIGRMHAHLDLDMTDLTTLRTVSHNHCTIRYDPARLRCVLANEGRNGTRIRRGDKVHFVQDTMDLQYGDAVIVGGVELKFEKPMHAERPAPDKPRVVLLKRRRAGTR